MATQDSQNALSKQPQTLSEISTKKFKEISLIGNYKYFDFYGCILS